MFSLGYSQPVWSRFGLDIVNQSGHGLVREIVNQSGQGLVSEFLKRCTQPIRLRFGLGFFK